MPATRPSTSSNHTQTPSLCTPLVQIHIRQYTFRITFIPQILLVPDIRCINCYNISSSSPCHTLNQPSKAYHESFATQSMDTSSAQPKSSNRKPASRQRGSRSTTATTSLLLNLSRSSTARYLRRAKPAMERRSWFSTKLRSSEEPYLTSKNCYNHQTS